MIFQSKSIYVSKVSLYFCNFYKLIISNDGFNGNTVDNF